MRLKQRRYVTRESEYGFREYHVLCRSKSPSYKDCGGLATRCHSTCWRNVDKQCRAEWKIVLPVSLTLVWWCPNVFSAILQFLIDLDPSLWSTAATWQPCKRATLEGQ